jgi:hypothetical protein
LKFLHNLSLALAAGAVGGLLQALAAAACSYGGLNALVGSVWHHELSRTLIYRQVVWGALWGILFLLHRPRLPCLWRGMIFSLGPTLAQLLLAFPHQGQGWLGLSLGPATPLLAMGYGLLWGLSAAAWLMLLAEE